MFAITGIIQGNTILTDYSSLEYYNGRKVIITVLEDDKRIIPFLMKNFLRFPILSSIRISKCIRNWLNDFL